MIPVTLVTTELPGEPGVLGLDGSMLFYSRECEGPKGSGTGTRVHADWQSAFCSNEKSKYHRKSGFQHRLEGAQAVHSGHDAAGAGIGVEQPCSFKHNPVCVQTREVPFL